MRRRPDRGGDVGRQLIRAGHGGKSFSSRPQRGTPSRTPHPAASSARGGCCLRRAGPASGMTGSRIAAGQFPRSFGPVPFLRQQLRDLALPQRCVALVQRQCQLRRLVAAGQGRRGDGALAVATATFCISAFTTRCWRCRPFRVRNACSAEGTGHSARAGTAAAGRLACASIADCRATPWRSTALRKKRRQFPRKAGGGWCVDWYGWCDWCGWCGSYDWTWTNLASSRPSGNVFSGTISPPSASLQRQFGLSAVLNQSEYAAVKRAIRASVTLGMMMARDRRSGKAVGRSARSRRRAAERPRQGMRVQQHLRAHRVQRSGQIGGPQAAAQRLAGKSGQALHHQPRPQRQHRMAVARPERAWGRAPGHAGRPEGPLQMRPRTAGPAGHGRANHLVAAGHDAVETQADVGPDLRRGAAEGTARPWRSAPVQMHVTAVRPDPRPIQRPDGPAMSSCAPVRGFRRSAPG